MIEDETGLTVRQLGPFMRACSRSYGIGDDVPICGAWTSIKGDRLEAGIAVEARGYVPSIKCDVGFNR